MSQPYDHRTEVRSPIIPAIQPYHSHPLSLILQSLPHVGEGKGGVSEGVGEQAKGRGQHGEKCHNHTTIVPRCVRLSSLLYSHTTPTPSLSSYNLCRMLGNVRDALPSW